MIQEKEYFLLVEKDKCRKVISTTKILKNGITVEDIDWDLTKERGESMLTGDGCVTDADGVANKNIHANFGVIGL